MMSYTSLRNFPGDGASAVQSKNETPLDYCVILLYCVHSLRANCAFASALQPLLSYSMQYLLCIRKILKFNFVQLSTVKKLLNFSCWSASVEPNVSRLSLLSLWWILLHNTMHHRHVCIYVCMSV
jgi:hypothetical protein